MSQVLEQVQRRIDHGIGRPRFGVVAVQVTEFDDDRFHAGGAAGLHIAAVVTDVDAEVGFDADAFLLFIDLIDS